MRQPPAAMTYLAGREIARLAGGILEPQRDGKGCVIRRNIARASAIARAVKARVLPVDKHSAELEYWSDRHRAEGGALSNGHYEPLFTDAFGLGRSDFAEMRVLDIGCGPRGSLEWASMARERIGVDPLADEYRCLGADRHAMTYVAANCECLPFQDGHFDIVSCLNALDHVDDLTASIAEIKRVLRPAGLFLLSVEIEHRPTATEPITVNDVALADLAPELEVEYAYRVGTPSDHNLHRAVLTRDPPWVRGATGIHVGRYRRQSEGD